MGSNFNNRKKWPRSISNFTFHVSFPENYFQGHLGSPEVRNSKKKVKLWQNMKNSQQYSIYR